MCPWASGFLKTEKMEKPSASETCDCKACNSESLSRRGEWVSADFLQIWVCAKDFLFRRAWTMTTSMAALSITHPVWRSPSCCWSSCLHSAHPFLPACSSSQVPQPQPCSLSSPPLGPSWCECLFTNQTSPATCWSSPAFTFPSYFFSIHEEYTLSQLPWNPSII